MNINENMPVTYDASYPPVKVMRQNKDYIYLLRPAVSSCFSEMTATTTYLYQGWNMEPEHACIAGIIKRIAKVEMHHLDLLARAMVLLGGYPGFAENGCQFWSGMAVEKCLDIKNVLKNNIESEEGAASYYNKTASQVRDCYLKGLLERLAQDERVHIKIFESMLKEIS